MPSAANAGIARTVQKFLDEHDVDYELVPHSPAGTSSETAQVAHVPGANLAKAVAIDSGERLILVVVPATEQVHLGELREELGQHVALATESGLQRVFTDCQVGSVPPFGQAYGVEVVLDCALLEHDRVYAESGDRAALLALRGQDFAELMRDSRRGRYGHPA